MRPTTQTLLAAALLLAPAAPATAAVSPGAERIRSAIAPPPDTAITTKFEVDGVSVILRRNTASEVIAANLYLLGGARQITPANAGIEALVLLASERGTRRFPGPTVRQLTATLGSTISIEANDDWSAIGLHAIRATFDSTWAILADRVMAPSLAAAEVEIAREQMIAGARQRATHPDDAAEQLADSLLYYQHPYALAATGTPASLASITVPELRAYHVQQFVTSRMLLVVVGNVERVAIERLVRRTIATLPRGTYKWSPPPPAGGAGRALAIDNRTIPTNYVLGYVPGPIATSRDYVALRVATAVLSGRLYTEVRSRRNLSYDVESQFIERAQGVGGLYVTTVDPNAVLRIMRHELSTLQSETVDPEGLKRLAQQFITEYYLKNETNADQANVLARAEVFAGDYRAADRFMAELKRVTPEDIRRVARQYLKDFRFAYVGDATKLDRSLLTQF
ncbi:MAG TPA: pitrilysin family protein [Gemmatimonadaceae bacterium]|nr:pitrilysin family protein [Gemmatimonadaceae bacterium]